MKSSRSYQRRGTPDFPLAFYVGVAGKNMKTRGITDHHPELEIAMQIQGTTTGQIDETLMRFHAGDIWIIPCGVPHQRIDFSSDAVVYRIAFAAEAIKMSPTNFFQKEFVQPLFDGRLEIPTLLHPGHPAYDTVRTQLLEFNNSPLYGKNYKQKRLVSLMQICMAIMPYCRLKENTPAIPDVKHDGVRQCMRYIHNNYTRRIALKTLADHCHLHPTYLCDVFKQHTGYSIFEYIAKFRIDTAAELLRREDLSVSQVAELSGFRSECLFYRKFKALMGMPPKAYAKQHKEK